MYVNLKKIKMAAYSYVATINTTQKRNLIRNHLIVKFHDYTNNSLIREARRDGRTEDRQKVITKAHRVNNDELK